MLHRHARPAVAGSFLAGTIAGALTTGFALAILAGLFSPIPGPARATVAVCALGLLGAHQGGLLCLGLPQRAWQIPQQVFHQVPTRAAFRFAYELGTGVRTYITTAAPYGLAVAIVLTAPPGPLVALASTGSAAVGYGIGRALIVIAQLGRRRVAVDHPRPWLVAGSWVSLAAAVATSVSALG